MIIDGDSKRPNELPGPLSCFTERAQKRSTGAIEHFDALTEVGALTVQTATYDYDYLSDEVSWLFGTTSLDGLTGLRRVSGANGGVPWETELTGPKGTVGVDFPWDGPRNTGWYGVDDRPRLAGPAADLNGDGVPDLV